MPEVQGAAMIPPQQNRYGNAPWSRPWSVIIADCPWEFDDPLGARGAEANYPTMSLEEICALQPAAADDSALFLWRVASMQREAFRVLTAWGFQLKTEIVWVKKTVKGRRHMGMGRIVRGEHETCLVAVRGKPEVQNRDVRSCFYATVGPHSAKPDAFYGIVERLFKGPYLEMFARRWRDGWTQWGREMPPEEKR